MTGTLRSTVVVAIAVVVATLFPLSRLTGDGRLWLVGVTTVVVLQLVGGLARMLSNAGWVPVAAQWVSAHAGFHLIARQIVPPTDADGLLSAPVETGRLALRHMADQPAPMAPDDAVLWLLAIGVALVTIAVDLCFITWRTALLAAVPLLAGYVAAVAVHDDPVPAVTLVAVTFGWLVLLASRTIDHDRRWTRGLSRGGNAPLKVGHFSSLALRLAIPAVAAALVAGLAVPHTGRPDWWPERADRGTVQLTDPNIELNENLMRPEDRPVLSYTTDSPGGLYLRTSTLTQVHAGGWSQISMTLLEGFPTRVPGLSDTTPTLNTSIEVGEFASNYLPAPYAPVSWDADGEWNYDPLSLTVLNVDRRRGSEAVTGLSYTVASRSIEPSSEALATAVAGTPPDGVVAREVPADVPPEIIAIAEQVTADEPTDGRKAVALQDYLRNPERFTYDLTAPNGNGYDVLVNFLTSTRRGYCIHFAAAMSLMARAVAIPSRVAVGFTPGTQQPDGSWLVTSHNMHAWPELYFSGLGWVRFEPTVSVAEEPAWTNLPDPQAPAEPSTAPNSPLQPSADVPTDPAQQPDLPAGSAGESWTTVAAQWALGVLIALMVLSIPGLARLGRRRARLHAASVQARVAGGWRELQDSAMDLGVNWPSGTPRQLAAARWPGLDEQGRAALGRVALLAERRLYAPGLPEQVDVADDVQLVRRQWGAAAGTPRRLRAAIAPSSLLRMPGTGAAGLTQSARK